MEGKLIKRGKESYRLFVNDAPFAQIEESPYKKLSLKNCEAIANGYDVFELAYDSSKEFLIESTHSPSFTFGYEQGFQKALSILGDKKFSELDMRIAYDAGCNNIDADDNIDFQDTINSLQQTELDVEIEQVLVQSSIEGEAIWKLKLDVNGCLILKRI